MDSTFHACARLFARVLAVLFLLDSFYEHFEALLHKILVDYAQDIFVLNGPPSLEMFRGRSSKSTTTLTKLNHSAMTSSE